MCVFPAPVGAFDRTYEGLKLPIPSPAVGRGEEHAPFDRTYEGLKLRDAERRWLEHLPFDRTYEGLKPVLHSAPPPH